MERELLKSRYRKARRKAAILVANAESHLAKGNTGAAAMALNAAKVQISLSKVHAALLGAV